jgi:long-subunit fatty acid transport protein
MRCHILTVLATLAATAIADVKFSSPAAGAQIVGGSSLTITWADDGTAPTIDKFATYTLNLMAGGNTAATSVRSILLHICRSSANTGCRMPFSASALALTLVQLAP